MDNHVKLAYAAVIGWMLVICAISLAVAIAPEPLQTKLTRVWYAVLLTPILTGFGWALWVTFRN